MAFAFEPERDAEHHPSGRKPRVEYAKMAA